MDDGRSPIIIDNTNIQAWEMKPYVQMVGFRFSSLTVSFQTTFIDPNYIFRLVTQAVDRGYKVDFCEPDTTWKFDPRELEKYDFLNYHITLTEQRIHWKEYRNVRHHTALLSLQEEQARRSPGEDCADDGSFLITYIHRHRHEFTRAASREPETSTRAATKDDETPRFLLVFLQRTLTK